MERNNLSAINVALSKTIQRTVRIFFTSDPGHDRSNHINYLCVMIVLVILPFFLKFENQNISFLGIHLPSTCMSQKLFKSECPGCGLTRSFVLLAHGHIRNSFQYHRLGLLLYVFFIYQIFYRIYALCHLQQPLPSKIIKIQNYSAYIIILALFINWGIGFFLGGNGS